MDLSGRGVFITGGAQGIGHAMLTALLQKGARVFFCDINSELGLSVEDELRQKYGQDNVGFMQCDVTSHDQLKAAFDGAVSQFGAVQICCNNAGIMDERIMDKTIAVNMTAQIHGCQLALEHMRRDKGGSGGVIVNTVSIAGFAPCHFLPVYTATKHAMIGYTTSCASDPAMPALGVRWSSLCPMPVNTGMLRFKGGEIYDVDAFGEFVKPVMIEPEDVAQALVTLLQDVESNGKSMVVLKGLGGVYRRRMMVGDDGESNPQLVDKPLSEHPPVPGALAKGEENQQ